MYVDKIKLEALHGELEEWYERFMREVSVILEQIKEADTVEEIMSLKRELLLEHLRAMPLGPRHCYFCLVYEDECDLCPYSKHHGRCGLPGSDYREIFDTYEALRDLIKTKYYNHEVYEDVDNTNEEEEKYDWIGDW